MAFGGWVLRGEIAKRGGGDALASLTTNDKEIARNPIRPQGWGGIPSLCQSALSSLELLFRGGEFVPFIRHEIRFPEPGWF